MNIYQVVNRRKFLLLIQSLQNTQNFFLIKNAPAGSDAVNQYFFQIRHTTKLKHQFIDTSKRYQLEKNSLPLKLYTNLAKKDEEQFWLFLQNNLVSKIKEVN